ncbi:kinesin, putative [Trypanosoma equiperdum]|uniref:Kinesin, putative n=1 Tax=Trypanosoma equiperdum TaxID=5694 RepID=A0A1G4I0D8_TRYEQ|nr:kinesin, putative [Trypanosoma equiperdum]
MMSSSSSAQVLAGIPQIGATTPVTTQSTVKREGSTPVRCRGKVERTPRGSQSSQDAVRVAVRVKPSSDNSNLLRYVIETGTLTTTPRTGCRRESARLGSANQCAKSAEEAANIGGGGQGDERGSLSNMSLSSSSNINGGPVVTGRGATRPVPCFAPIAGTEEGNMLTVITPTADGAKEVQRTYEFGRVFGPSVSDSEICESIVPGIVEQLRAGFNACVLCYGQTGSGKTHTINVLAPAFINALFDNLDAENDIVELSYIQIYNNNAYNLLGRGKSEHGMLLQKPLGTAVPEPRYLVQNATLAIARIAEAQRKRFVSHHALNARSSRSHVLLSLHVTKCVGGIPVFTSRLTLGDLAGSERVKRTGVVGDELGEAIAINKSLSVLHSVIRATAEEADVLPVRESMLTLYLASTLADCYLLLIATVSLDKRSAAETKSSLDFATTAKRCVLTKTKERVRDLLMRNGCSFEEAYGNLTREIETLRHRVATLQEEVNIEKQLSSLTRREKHAPNSNDGMDHEGKEPEQPQKVNGDAATNTENSLANASGANSAEDPVIRDHVVALERQCAIFQSVLRERERDLCSLESRGDVAEELRQELEQRVRQCDEAQQTLEEAVLEVGTSELLHKVTDTFRWMQEQFDSMSEQKQVMAKTVEAMRSEQKRTMAELLEARKHIVQTEKSCEELRQRLERVTNENTGLTDQLEELNLKLLHEYTERVIREETVAWFKASGERAEECERLTTAFEDQRNLCDVLQSRLTSTEEELERGNKEHCALLQEMQKKDEAFRSIWILLTPQQKARFMSVGYGGDVVENSGSASLHQGHENVQLRSQVRTLKKQLEDEILCSRERDYRIEDLECENRLLQERLLHRENEYKSLVALDQDYMDEREQMEGQIAHLYTYIEEHNMKQRTSERQLREVQIEWEKLNEEYCNSQREVAELTAKLNKAKEEIRIQEANKHVLKNRHQHESRERDMKLAVLQHQLAVKQRTTDEVSRRLGLAERRRQHVTATVTAHKHHSDLVRRKAMKRNPELLRCQVGQPITTSQLIRATSLQTSLKRGHSQRPQRDAPKGLLRSRSSVSVDAAAGMRWDSRSSSNNQNGYVRRRTFSLNKQRDAPARSKFARTNSTLVERPALFF